ncbi:MAG: hypothetical protein AB1941_01860 [Gemmatimonadota bacterium]
MSPHRATPFVHQVAAVLAVDSTLSIVAVVAGVGTALWSLISGYHFLLAAAVILAQVADVFCGARRAWKAKPRTFSKERLRASPWDKGYRLVGAVLIGGCADLFLAIFGRFAEVVLTGIGADPARAALASEYGSMGVATMLALAAVFAAEFVSAVDNYRSTEGDVDLRFALWLSRFFSVVTRQMMPGVEGPTPARRAEDAALRDLQVDGLAPPVPGEGMVPDPLPSGKDGTR